MTNVLLLVVIVLQIGIAVQSLRRDRTAREDAYTIGVMIYAVAPDPDRVRAALQKNRLSRTRRRRLRIVLPTEHDMKTISDQDQVPPS